MVAESLPKACRGGCGSFPLRSARRPGSACTRSRNAAPRTSKLRILVERGAGGRQQHHRLGRRPTPPHRAPPARPRGRACRRSRTAPCRRACAANSVGRLADQVGLADAREEAGQAVDAAGLRLAAGDPENVGEARQRPRRGVRVGRLGIVDEQHAALAADLLHAVGEAGKRAQARAGSCSRREAERQRGAGRAGGVLRIVQAAQRADAAEMRDRRARCRLPPA